MGCGAGVSNTTIPTLNGIYERKELIGEGTFGKVYRCLNRLNGQEYALKVVAITAKTKEEAIKQIAALRSEISVWKRLNHPNVIRYYSFDISPAQDSVEIVLEYAAQGSLKDYIKANGAVPQKQASLFCRQILQGLKYLHGQLVVHRDLKCANILIAAGGVLKITDFGTAKAIKVISNEDIARVCGSLKGTPYYMAPEMLKRTGHNASADIWSFGCTLIQMLGGKAPWVTLTTNFQQIISYIVSGVHPPFPPCLTEECVCFLQSCLYATPSQRLTAELLLHHRFIDQLQSRSLQIIQGILLPSQNIGEKQKNTIESQKKVKNDSVGKKNINERKANTNEKKRINKRKNNKQSLKMNESTKFIDENEQLQIIQMNNNIFSEEDIKLKVNYKTQPRIKLPESVCQELYEDDRIDSQLFSKDESHKVKTETSAGGDAINTVIACEQRKRYLDNQKILREQRQSERMKWEKQLKEGGAFLRKEITNRYHI